MQFPVPILGSTVVRNLVRLNPAALPEHGSERVEIALLYAGSFSRWTETREQTDILS